MKEYILKSDYEYLITINGSQILLNKFNSYSVNLDDNENTLIKIYPLFTSPKSLPFCCDLSSPNMKNIEVLNIDEKTHIKINPYTISTYEDVLQQEFLDYKNGKVFISVNTDKIFVFYKTKSIALENSDAQKYNFYIKQNKLIGEGEYNIIFVNLGTFDGNTNPFDKINTNNEFIECLKDEKDFSSHLKTTKLSFLNENIEKELYYKQGKPQKTTNENLIPFVVLDSIKLGDLQLAKSYFSKNIMLDDSILLNYFNDFDKYEFIDGEFYLIKNGKAYKKLSFIQNNGLIIDIDDKEI